MIEEFDFIQTNLELLDHTEETRRYDLQDKFLK